MTTLAAALTAFTSLALAAPSDLAGCYQLDRAHFTDIYEPLGPRLGTAFVDKEVVRCFEADGGVVERRAVRYEHPYGGGYTRRLAAGVWSVRGDVLRIRWDSDDEGEWDYELFDGGLDVGGELWRAIDLDPARLRAELEASEADQAEEGNEEDVSEGDESDSDSDDADEEADLDADDEGDEDVDALAEDDAEDEDVADL